MLVETYFALANASGCKKKMFERFRKQNGYGTYDWTFFAWAVAEVHCIFKLFLHG